MSSRSTPSSFTGTLTLTPESRPSNPQPRNLVLRLRPPKKKVTWEEGTVDNEFLNRKSSKKCCIFHKQKPFDEDASDDDGDEGGEGDRAGPSGGGSCSSHACRS